MKNQFPDSLTIFPIEKFHQLCFLKNIVKNKRIEIGEYTYYHDFDNVHNFEQNVKYLFDNMNDKLIIGKFCMIASDVKFIMGGAQHITDGITAYPFDIFHEDWKHKMKGISYPKKGDTIIGNDVWLGYQSTILSGVKIGDGAIVGTASVVTKDVPPYTIVGGNPAKIIRPRFDPNTINQLLKLKWWNWDIKKISKHIPELVQGHLEKLVSDQFKES